MSNVPTKISHRMTAAPFHLVDGLAKSRDVGARDLGFFFWYIQNHDFSFGEKLLPRQGYLRVAFNTTGMAV